jgi:hypothetical protein
VWPRAQEEAPQGEAAATEDARVGRGDLAVGCRKADLVTGVDQRSPGDRRLGRIELTSREWEQDPQGPSRLALQRNEAK